MSTHLPDAVKRGLEEARVAMLRKSGRLCVHVDDEVYRVAKVWDGGFTILADSVPHLRGYVDLYDGPAHLMRCLVVASRTEDGQTTCTYKRATPVTTAPAVDFEQVAPQPRALLSRLF